MMPGLLIFKDNRIGPFPSFRAYRPESVVGRKLPAGVHARKPAVFLKHIFEKLYNMLRTVLPVLLFGITIGFSASSQTIKRITSVNDSYPALSPDGRTLLFQSDRSGDIELWSIGIDGTGLKKLTH